MELSLLKEALGIDLVINPENAAAAEIARLLRFPPAANLETFCRGRVELIGFRVREEDFLVGHPLSAQSGQLQSSLCCSVPPSGRREMWSSPTVPLCPRWGTGSI